MACAVVQPTEGRVPVRLLIPKDEAVTVQKVAAIAVMEELDEPICGANAIEEDPTTTATVPDEKQTSCGKWWHGYRSSESLKDNLLAG